MKKCYFLLAMLFACLGMTVQAQDNSDTVTQWNGSALRVTIKAGENRTFSYTAHEKGTLYIMATDQNSTTQVRVSMSGGLWQDGAFDPDSPLQDTENGYESGIGVYGKMNVWDGDEIRFTITGISTEDNAGASTSFTLKSTFFKPDVKGDSWESPIELEMNKSVSIPVYPNYMLDMFPRYKELTFCRFVAPSDGVACVVASPYEILYMQEDLFDGSVPFASCIEGAQANEHEFAVIKDHAYLVALPVSRPENIRVKMSTDHIGGSCNAPIEISGTQAVLSLVKGQNWYKLDVSELGSQNFMDVAVSEGWNGNITYMANCMYEHNTLGADEVGGQAAIFHKNLAPDNTDNNDYLYINITLTDQDQVENAVTLTLREPEEGETCAMAIPVQAGQNAFEGEARDYWFVYYPERDADTEFSSRNAIRYISNSCGQSNSMDLTGNHKYRVYANKPLYICIRTSQTGQDTLNILEKEIAPGMYCDYPLDFQLGEPVAITDRVGTAQKLETTYLRFTAEKSGIAYIETTNANWTNSYWTVLVKNDCAGGSLPVDRIEDEDPETGDLLLRYKFAVTANATYIFSVTAGANGGKDILVNSRFETATTGSICEDPNIITALNENIAISSEENTTTWFTYTADKTGFYHIVMCLRGSCRVKIGDCGAKEETIPIDYSIDNAYMRGYSYTKIFVKEGTPFFIYTKSNNPPYSNEDPFFINVSFSEARPGETFAGAIDATAGTLYDMPSGKNAFDTWYVYTIPAGLEQIIELGSNETNFAYLTFYTDENTSLSSYRKDFIQENVYNEEGKMCGKRYTFEPADTKRVIYIKVPTQNLAVWWTIHPIIADAIGNTQAAETLTISPNPNTGIFCVNVPAVEAGATVTIRTLAGAEVYSAPLTSPSTTVNLSSKLSAGVYLVTVSNGATVTSKMIVK